MKTVYAEVSVYCRRTKISTIEKGKKRYTEFMLYLRAKSFNRQLQLLVKLTMKGVGLLMPYICLTTTITC
jgi:hypothetical protein